MRFIESAEEFVAERSGETYGDLRGLAIEDGVRPGSQSGAEQFVLFRGKRGCHEFVEAVALAGFGLGLTEDREPERDGGFLGLFEEASEV